MIFNKESEFEEALIKVLKQHGWDDAGGVLKYSTEQDLIDNWASILLQNNSQVDRLDGVPLTSTEMAQILEQIEELKTPLALNSFINGKSVSIVRDNPDDPLHLGKEISLKIYDRKEIAAGQSRYQIAQQPKYKARSKMLNDRRGDVTLLINGMPVIHLELKRTGVPISEAYGQIKTYANEGVFSGIFRLIQVFGAMNPDDAVYFANPGRDNFNENFYFHWADYNNEPINNYKKLAEKLYSIPMAHQLIGFYTVADSSDGCLKVLRSYQYYAASAISDRVKKCRWDIPSPNSLPGRPGGFVWHTTGSGKTLTSFKAAQLVADSKDADKVIFLQDRIELGTQTLREYKAFADDKDEIQDTEDTTALVNKLDSTDPKDTLIVTSIQKMSRVKLSNRNIDAKKLEQLASKRTVFILDECHRSTFGSMLQDIRHSFPNALYFGFTGTPIHDENQKKNATTKMVFGDELHRYSIADGIRDKNVLAFDPYMVCTFKDRDVREQVALNQAKADNLDDVLADKKKSKVYYYFMDTSKVPMESYLDDKGKFVKGIEGYLPKSQYSPETAHAREVVKDICDQFKRLSRGGRYHALFATSSILEAISYYKLFKKQASKLKVTALFDPSIDFNPGCVEKEDALVEIISDYNARYNKEFTIPTWAQMKKDISARLAHKKPYLRLENSPEECIDILIVVDQMLTGFDSRWINTLYMDKLLEYENIIQAFSRTNRPNGEDKPFGTIKYYRKPHTMRKRIGDAVKLYSGDKPFALFVCKLPENIEGMNARLKEISAVFESSGVEEYMHLPESKEACKMFAKKFVELNEFLESAKLQGFSFEKLDYEFERDDGTVEFVHCELSEQTYNVLLQRYKELFDGPDVPDEPGEPEAPYDLVGYLTEIDTGRIDSDYMNANFTKWMRALGGDEESATSKELHRSFAHLSQEDQRFAGLILRDIERGEFHVEDGMSFSDCINLYARQEKDEQLNKLVDALGVDMRLLEEMMRLNLNKANINEYGRFDRLKDTIDTDCAKAFFEEAEGNEVSSFSANMKAAKLLRDFILKDGFEI